MNFFIQRLVQIPALLIYCFLLVVTQVKAEEPSSADRWKIVGSAYMWASGVEGTTSTGDKIDSSFSDVLDTLDGGVMGLVTARKGRWAVRADLIYLSLNDETSTTVNLDGPTGTLDVDTDIKGLVSNISLAYQIVDDERTKVDLLAGARYFKLDVDGDTVFMGSKNKFSDSGNVLDGVVGAQVRINLNEKWFLSFYTDVGTGDSKLTWQAWPGVGYKFEKLDMVLGYRRITWETDDGDDFDDLSFKGPTFGVQYRF